MPAKQKTPKVGMSKIAKDQRQERKMIGDMAKRERVMKWLLIGIAILLLLLILFVGYATDWLKGVSKDDTVGTTGITSANDAATTPDGSTGTSTSTTGSTGTSSTGKTSTTGSTSNTGTSNNTGTTSTNTSKDTSSTTTTTNNNTTTTGTGTTSDSGLLSLYANTSVGDSISSILDSVPSLVGVSKSCHTDILIQVCDFTDGNLTVTTKNLLGTGIITSVTKNF